MYFVWHRILYKTVATADTVSPLSVQNYLFSYQYQDIIYRLSYLRIYVGVYNILDCACTPATTIDREIDIFTLYTMRATGTYLYIIIFRIRLWKNANRKTYNMQNERACFTITWYYNIYRNAYKPSYRRACAYSCRCCGRAHAAAPPPFGSATPCN